MEKRQNVPIMSPLSLQFLTHLLQTFHSLSDSVAQLPTHPHKMAQPPFLLLWFPPNPWLLHFFLSPWITRPIQTFLRSKDSKWLIYLRLSLHPQSSVHRGQQSEKTPDPTDRRAWRCCQLVIHDSTKMSERQQWAWEPWSHKEKARD